MDGAYCATMVSYRLMDRIMQLKLNGDESGNLYLK